MPVQWKAIAVVLLAMIVVTSSSSSQDPAPLRFSLGSVRHLASTDEHFRILQDFEEDKYGIRSMASRHEYARRLFSEGDMSSAEDGEEDTTAGDGAYQVSPLWQGLGTHYCE